MGEKPNQTKPKQRNQLRIKFFKPPAGAFSWQRGMLRDIRLAY